ncbi:Flp pilus assembly protein CpaB [Ornithinicoccus halotolerans]|uniref:Flp pilus assembly protein CpaB n=1 Tax=Ornithinicoccus halotolerans TaxID=1748220 RepID=UPI00129556EE|nr:Flp pilus assembly protein CpaB [Ornithinicoccus halotolerans]
MVRRIVAALAALILAAVAIVLVVAYTSSADERALAGQETESVLVATAAIPEGTSGDALTELVENQPVPRNYLVDGVVSDLADLQGRISTTRITPGEQIVASRFATPEELRARDEFTLPEEAADLHQLTIPLTKPQALGGNIAPGDRVGVFVAMEPEYPEEESAGEESDGEDSEPETFSMAHVVLHKVLVVRVEGGYVEPPPTLDEEVEAQEAEPQQAEDTILVTLAMPAPDVEKMVFAKEFGQVHLTYEPEGADENGTEPVVVTFPENVRDLFE